MEQEIKDFFKSLHLHKKYVMQAGLIVGSIPEERLFNHDASNLPRRSILITPGNFMAIRRSRLDSPGPGCTTFISMIITGIIGCSPMDIVLPAAESN